MMPTDEPCFSVSAAVPFFEMRKFIADRKPKLLILENVKGLLAPNSETNSSPIDFVWRGRKIHEEPGPNPVENPLAPEGVLRLCATLRGLRSPSDLIGSRECMGQDRIGKSLALRSAPFKGCARHMCVRTKV